MRKNVVHGWQGCAVVVLMLGAAVVNAGEDPGDPGDLLFRGNAGWVCAAVSLFAEQPCHVGIYVGDADGGGEKVVEATSLFDNVTATPLAEFRTTGEAALIYGARTTSPPPTPSQRRLIVAYVMTKAEGCTTYAFTKCGQSQLCGFPTDAFDNCSVFSCVGLAERAYEVAGLDPVPSDLELPFLQPSVQFTLTYDTLLPTCMYIVGQGNTYPPLIDPTSFDNAYDRNGGKPVVGCPDNKVHAWGNGHLQDFSGGTGWNGALMQRDGSPTAYWVHGAIWDRYVGDLGGAPGFLGYPLGDEAEGAASSISGARNRYSQFEGGYIEHHASGPRAGLTVWLGHGIVEKWGKTGFGAGVLGLPITDERDALPSGAAGFSTTGKVAEFEGGHIHWHGSGPRFQQAFETHGEIDDRYVALGGTASYLGFPISDVYGTSNLQADFEGGSIICTGSTNCLVAVCSVAGDCSDGNPCTDDVCSNGQCSNPPKPDGTWCPGSYCVGGQCGVCNSGSDCSDGNPCTDDVCSGGQCSNPSKPDGTVCPGGYCSGGACGECSTSAHCDDWNPCTDNVCSGGQCSNPPKPNGTACAGGSCNNGSCVSAHTLTITEPANGSPDPVVPGGWADLSVTAVDSEGHGLRYSWTASCPTLSSNGTLTGTATRTPTWQAPMNDASTDQYCTMEVTVRDGYGLNQTSSYDQGVFPGGPSSLEIVDGIKLVESPPYVPDQTFTVDVTVKNVGPVSLFLRRIIAEGSFEDSLDPRFGPYSRSWPSDQFNPPLVLSPGGTYRYTKQLINDLALPTRATVRLEVHFDGITGMKQITKAAPGATAQLVFIISGGDVSQVRIDDGVRFMEPAPYRVGGTATVDATIGNLSGRTLVYQRIQAVGEFADEYGSVYRRYWPVRECNPVCYLNGTGTYHYRRLLVDSFPAVPTTGQVWIDVEFYHNPGQKRITNTAPGAAGEFTFSVTECGNTRVEAGEECDPGPDIPDDCCSSDCKFVSSGVVCRPSVGVCDVAETCTGASAQCPVDVKSTGVCRSVAGPCDAAERCDGVADGCPPDVFLPGGTECRPSAGVCDVAEACTGSSAQCPADVKSIGVCRSLAGPCDVAETCDGVASSCPFDLFLPGGTQCRASAGVCDVAETCTGASAQCPADVKSTEVCRRQTGPCDVTESCDGASDVCPTDLFAPDDTPCDDGLFCNGTDACLDGTCSGHSGDPCAGGLECADNCNEEADDCFDPAGTACTDDANVCTDDECDGTGSCVHPDNTNVCNDHDDCTAQDTCANGLCTGETVADCASLGDVDCDGQLNPSDALMALCLFVQICDGTNLPAPCNDETHRLRVADWDRSEQINVSDAVKTLEIFVGLTSTCDTALGICCCP